ncbi:MAG: LolA family protein [Candidatus Kapaibacteriota bacterium]
MKIISTMFLFSLILIFTHSIVLSQTKEDIFNELKASYSNLSKISFSFQSMENKSYQGHLTATKDGKYKLILPDKIIISDGKTNWNYTVRDKVVVISNVSNQNNSLQTIFFNIINNFYPTELKETLSSKKGKVLQLSLQSKNNKDEKLVLFLNNKNLKIQQIVFNYNNSIGNYTISQLTLNPQLDNSEFSFNVPKGVEEIDLR